MRKVYLRSLKMSQAGEFVDEARSWALALVRAESRFPGDYASAMRRVARRAKVPFGLLWSLHYRLPKTIPVERYAALAGAYADAQRDRYRTERSGIEATTWLGKILLRAADRVAGD